MSSEPLLGYDTVPQSVDSITFLQNSTDELGLTEEAGLGALCRVCHGDVSDGGPLLSPCLCTGSVQFIHCSCLNEWRAQSSRLRDALRCELCGFDYLFKFRRASSREATLQLLGNLALVAPAVGFLIIFLFQAYPVDNVAHAVFTTSGIWSALDLGLSVAGQKHSWEGFSVGIARESLHQLHSLARSSYGSEVAAVSNILVEELAKAEAAQQEWSNQMVSRSEAEDDTDTWQAQEQYRRRCARWELYLLMALISAQAFVYYLRRCLGKKDMHLLHELFEGFGVVYCLFVLSLEIACSLLCPPLCIESDDSGLPIVRSLTAADREARAQQRSANIET